MNHPLGVYSTFLPTRGAQLSEGDDADDEGAADDGGLAERAITDELRAKMFGWRYFGGFSAHNQVRVAREGDIATAGVETLREHRVGRRRV